ncbi:MAG: alpha/beta hydrolase [Clostridia bacterium]|nr:alpha/beta hydrolase [Clostridia bacterium]
MEIILIIVAVLAGIIVVYCLTCFALALIINKFFGRRCDKNPLLKYFSAEDFALNTEEVQTKSGKNTIRGYIYNFFPLEECKNLVIFAHGMGPGQCAYTTEIAYLCKNGCAVLAFDNSGCNLSDGKSTKGLENGTICLTEAVRFAREDARFKDKKIVLVGHSMGGYAALCATKFCKADGVVAISAPDTPSQVVSYLAGQVMGGFAKRLTVYLKAVSRLKTGRYADLSASKVLAQSGTKALLIQGDSDPQVPVYLSAYAHAQGSSVNKIMCAGKKHNPYNTERAERELGILSAGLARSKDMSKEERDEFFSTRDYKVICEEDAAVMSAVMEFIKTV